MGWLEILLLALIALWVGAVLVFLCRRKNRGCSGCCENCGQDCTRRK